MRGGRDQEVITFNFPKLPLHFQLNMLVICPLSWIPLLLLPQVGECTVLVSNDCFMSDFEAMADEMIPLQSQCRQHVGILRNEHCYSNVLKTWLGSMGNAAFPRIPTQGLERCFPAASTAPRGPTAQH